ncbi:MAG: hypothetical protein GXP06_03335 [Alphaproteobacteria bacterium]|nr:hypothetical protein [Alphaproteobacteria bacterium]
MRISKILIAGAIAFALVACGDKDAGGEAPKSAASAKAAKVSAASPLDADFRLKDGEEVDIAALLAMMPDEANPTYDSVAFDKKIGATVVSNLRFADDDGGEGILIKRAEFYGVDVDAIARINDATDAGADAPFETVFQKVRLLDVSAEGVEEKEGAMSIGGIEFDKLAIRQGGPESDGKGNEAARFFNAVSLAGLYFKDISFSVEESEGASIAMVAPDLRFVGMADGKLGAIIANGLDYKVSQSDKAIANLGQAFGPQGAALMSGPLKQLLALSDQTTVAALAWRDIDFSNLLSWGLKGEAPPMTERNLIDLGTMKATDMETFVEGRRLATIEEATISAAEFTWLMPSKIRTDTKGGVYDFTAYVPETEEAVVEILKRHGLDEVKGDGYAEWNWNADSGVGALEYVVNADSAANISMGLGFSGLKLDDAAEAMENGEDNPLAVLGAFDNFSLKLEDKKALDAIFDLAALQMGGSGEDLRQSAPAMIRLSGMQLAQFNPRVSGYVEAVANFVAKGGTLEISANPAEPVSFSELESGGATPQTLPDVLDLKVTHTK